MPEARDLVAGLPDGRRDHRRGAGIPRGGRAGIGRPPGADGLAFGRDGSLSERINSSIYDYIHSFNTGLSDSEERELATLIYFESMKYGYDPEFILAIIQTESAFNPEAVSNVGAYGLMQLMPSTAREIAHEVKIPFEGKSTLSQPDLNVRMGTYYLFKMMLQFKDVRLALVAYNCGPGFVEEMVREGQQAARGVCG